MVESAAAPAGGPAAPVGVGHGRRWSRGRTHRGSGDEPLTGVAAALWDADSLTRRLIGLVALGAIIDGIIHGSPGPGLAGPGRAVLGLTAAASVLYLAWLVPPRTAGLSTLVIGGLGVIGAALGGLAPGVGLAFAFIAVLGAGRRLPAHRAFALTGAVVAVFDGVGWLWGRPLGLLAGISVGLVAAMLGGVNHAQTRRVREQAELLVAEGEVVVQEQARSTALAERARIAREIHDVLAHSLSGLVVQLEAVGLLLEQDAPRDRLTGHVDRARGLARGGLEETRRALSTLRGDPLPTATLLGELVESYRADTGCSASLEVRGEERPLPAEAGLTVYRVAQEALTNTRRHAPGAIVTVALTYTSTWVELIVTDTRPMPGASSSSSPLLAGAGSGYGLVGMRERAELLGGSLAAGPTEQGWRVALRIPT